MKDDLIRLVVIIIGLMLAAGFSLLISYGKAPVAGPVLISGFFLYTLGLVIGRFLERKGNE